MAALLGGGMLLVFFYCGCDWRPEPSFVKWARGRSADRWSPVVLSFAENLRLFSNAGEGLVRQIRHNVRGHGAYLLGEWRPRAFWYYFPVALSIKLSLAVLIASGFLLLRRWRTLINGAFLCSAALFLFSFNCRVQIGIRLVLPLIVLAVVGLAVALVRAQRAAGSPWERRLLPLGIVLGLVWTATDAVRVWPNWLSFTNEAWGGTATGYRWLSDSNFDWGQGLKELDRWRSANGVAEMKVWYFGSDPGVHRSPFQELKLHVLDEVEVADLPNALKGHVLAASTTLLHGYPRTNAHVAAMEYLRGCTPAGRTTTYFIYDFRESDGD